MLSFCHAGTVFDAQLARAEDACAKERERCREEAQEHAKTRAQASQLQVYSSPADLLAGPSMQLLCTPGRRVPEEYSRARLGALESRQLGLANYVPIALLQGRRSCALPAGTLCSHCNRGRVSFASQHIQIYAEGLCIPDKLVLSWSE